MCEILKVLQRVNPDLRCDENCYKSEVFCNLDLKKLVPKTEIKPDYSQSVFALKNIREIPQKKEI